MRCWTSARLRNRQTLTDKGWCIILWYNNKHEGEQNVSKIAKHACTELQAGQVGLKYSRHQCKHY